MKEKLAESTFVQSLLSLVVVVVFVLIGIGSIDLGQGGYLNVGYGYKSQETIELANGDYQQTTEYSYFYTVRTGKKDKYGRWEGPVKYEKYRNNKLVYSEEYTLVNSRRHGTTIIKKDGKSTVEECYRMGRKVDCIKSVKMNTAGSSAFNILTDKYPWYYRNFEILDIERDFTEAFLDTIETLLYKNEFTESEFDNYYQQALDELEGTIYDTLIIVNSFFTHMEGQEALKSSEFRMAVIDSYLSDNADTYSSLENTYPNYLHTMNSGGISYQDFETFCHDFDSILLTYEPLDKEDPFFTDSIDARTGTTLFTILGGEDSTKSAGLYLKSAQVLKKEKRLLGIWQQVSPLFREMKTDSVSQNVALFVVFFMIMEYDQADVIKKSVREAYYLNTNIVTLPVVTTEFSANNSSTSATLIGTVLESGGADVTSRGVAWAGFYNPSANDQTVTGGAGTGEFSVTLEGLIPGNNYYARAFAINSMGTAYGNCISFAAGVTGLEVIEKQNLDLIIFPNPASDLATCRFMANPAETLTLMIFDLNGRIVFQKEFENLAGGENQFQLDFSNWHSGMYYCRLSSISGDRITQKLIIAR